MIKEVYIWGAGKYGVLTALDCEQEGIKVLGFIDRDAERVKTRLGLPVLNIPPDNSHIIIAVKNENAINDITAFLISEKIDYGYSKFVLGNAVRVYFLQLNKELQTQEIKEIINFFEKNPFSVFPYEFIKKYKLPEVFYDEGCETHYVLHNGKKLYMPGEWDESKCANYYKSICIEQDIDSPHRYETEKYTVKTGDIIADIGAAEGIWALENIEKAKKIYLFECENKWIKALQKTFEPWKEKIEVINKFVSNTTEENKICLDDFFKEKEINFIKADIEGAELELLQGAKSVLQKQSVKLLLCAYHRENDEVILKDILEEYGFTTEYSKGYMLFIYDRKLKSPYVRRGLIRGNK